LHFGQTDTWDPGDGVPSSKYKVRLSKITKGALNRTRAFCSKPI
jgi:hypothetical protein